MNVVGTKKDGGLGSENWGNQGRGEEGTKCGLMRAEVVRNLRTDRVLFLFSLSNPSNPSQPTRIMIFITPHILEPRAIRFGRQIRQIYLVCTATRH